ncbi:MAG: 3-oxoacyl-[acyl-carrier-protein] reductase FabG [Gammaproteobacteria bacterium]|nr:MAG: 3-oxoacyl-ACP reductase FabG [Pseudomonadota bacterium]MBC6943947.1 3-oxoacyl-ACP reductase FabG [Gammaproteobacteria bacterium]MCE7895249.1 3-oxoacyl-ACP reductase FabG [Gammaproteobacteria bacterium PRO8]MDL1880265.1 3-oxoacyl-ACP reductase FabG [Gammaproteobacteria bacterium PRO2]MCL4776113.1 3-oxoacyl-ACP reductase FabG [Gammaproteobacteria bacterium]
MAGAFDLTGEVALVTGASRGIGSAIATALAAAGARVVGTATTSAGADQISERLASLGGQGGRGIVLDVSRPAEVLAAQKEIEGLEGSVSILINNAGITRDNLLMRMKDEEWDAVIATNLSSVFHLSRAFLRGMIKARRGRIVSIASVVGAMGNAGQANYSAAKAGLVGLSKSLAREVGSRGITVNVVAPGFIDTDMTGKLSEDQRRAMLAQIPMQKLGTVADVANAVVFLASPAGAYITGETLHVNGGMYMI